MGLPGTGASSVYSLLSKFCLPDLCSINKPASCQNVYHVKVPLDAPSVQESEILSQPGKMVVLSAPSQESTCFSYPQMLKSKSLSAFTQACSEAFIPGKNRKCCSAPLMNAECSEAVHLPSGRELHCAYGICLILPKSPMSNRNCWLTHIVVLDQAKWPNLPLLSLWLVTNTYIHQETSA